MGGNTFGRLFRVTTFGESHGRALGAVIDGCPPGIPLCEEDIQQDLERRRPGKHLGESPRREPDRVEILSGVFEGFTLGTPIALVIWNKDPRSSAYEPLKEVFRPGHGDCTYYWKYGRRDWRGGGRASGRETVARVAAGAVARKLLASYGIEVRAFTVALGGVRAEKWDPAEAERNHLFCPDPEAYTQMCRRIEEARREGDSLGGIVEVRATGVPPGLGEPVFDKLDAELAKALMGIGAVKGVEIGSGFRAAEKTGSENNDPLTPEGFLSNNAGGVLAGISSGQEILCRVAVKPIPSIAKEQKTINERGEPVTIRIGGRHDVSAIPRIVPVCEAMVRLVLADFLLRQLALKGFRSHEPLP
ncbi:MAG: chorismate synthase [Thermodesulfatator sp.]|nr:MAG: chorismate synthase [Thermodesulfatator sp.]